MKGTNRGKHKRSKSNNKRRSHQSLLTHPVVIVHLHRLSECPLQSLLQKLAPGPPAHHHPVHIHQEAPRPKQILLATAQGMVQVSQLATPQVQQSHKRQNLRQTFQPGRNRHQLLLHLHQQSRNQLQDGKNQHQLHRLLKRNQKKLLNHLGKHQVGKKLKRKQHPHHHYRQAQEYPKDLH